MIDKNNKEKNFVSAIVYVHNKERILEKFISMLYEELEKHFLKFEMIFVNDASTDDSVKVIEKVSEKFQNTIISILNMSYYQGMEQSMNAGMDLAIGDFVYEFDQVEIDYPREIIYQIYQESLKGYDIVSASAGRKQKFSSRIFYGIFNHSANMQYMLETETFRILSRRAINRVSAMSKTIPYRKAVYANCGLKLKNKKYTPNESIKQQREKQLRKNREELAINSLILFTDVAYRFSSIMTIVMMGITIIAAIYAAVIFFTGNPIAGWTTLILFMACCFFGLFALLSIIVRYLSIVLDLSFKKQKYVFESIEKISK